MMKLKIVDRASKQNNIMMIEEITSIDFWKRNIRLRVNISLYGALAWNIIYAVFQLVLGFRHNTMWYGSVGTYYICLAVMRFFLVRHTTLHDVGERKRDELIRYGICGWLLLAISTTLSVMVMFMVYRNLTFEHHKFTAVAMAAFTAIYLTVAIVNVIKYRRYKSPVYSAAKIISLVAASVSVLTLQSTILATFAQGADLATRKRTLGISGGIVFALVFGMAIFMIARSAKGLRALKK